MQGSTAVLSENNYAQYYGKFRSNAPKIKVMYFLYSDTCKIMYNYTFVHVYTFIHCNCLHMQTLMKEIEKRAENTTE